MPPPVILVRLAKTDGEEQRRAPGGSIVADRGGGYSSSSRAATRVDRLERIGNTAQVPVVDATMEDQQRRSPQSRYPTRYLTLGKVKVTSDEYSDRNVLRTPPIPVVRTPPCKVALSPFGASR